ncbi:antitoxin [Caldilinea sp.]|jgi:virulence-associated protein VagC|uniref:antitoxin n=1 Tax=Caldilinea sp. TaxID=2293560 RepID=UPI0021DED95C|nr:MAG: hypothetical protein KatS3mg048_1980 [Caldilinea sp.]
METARLFYSGSSQAVRLPKEYRFDGDRVYIKRLGNAVILSKAGCNKHSFHRLVEHKLAESRMGLHRQF